MGELRVSEDWWGTGRVAEEADETQISARTRSLLSTEFGREWVVYEILEALECLVSPCFISRVLIISANASPQAQFLLDH